MANNVTLKGEAVLHEPVLLPVEMIGDGCNFDAITFDVFLSLLDYEQIPSDRPSSCEGSHLTFSTRFKARGNRMQVIKFLPGLLMAKASSFSFTFGGEFRDFHVDYQDGILKITHKADLAAGGFYPPEDDVYYSESALAFWNDRWV